MHLLRCFPAVVFFAAIAFGRLARAQVVTPVPAPTIITTAPYTITTAGYYQLGANLTVTATSGNIITVNASNVTLDFAGHYISGPNNAPGSTLFGVYANERGNLIIRNGTITYCLHGIELEGNGTANSLNINQRIDNMLISYCYHRGIEISAGRNCDVTNSHITFIGGTTNFSDAIGIWTSGAGSRLIKNSVSNITTTTGTGGSAAGIHGGTNVFDNNVVIVTGPAGSVCYGLDGCTFASGNTVTTATTGLHNVTEYKDTMVAGCATSYSGGTAVGTNNSN